MKGISSYISQAAAIITLLIGALILGSWILDGPASATDRPVKFNTGICLFLSAITLLMLDRKEPGLAAKIIAAVCSFLVLLIASLTLAQYIFGTSLGIDEFFWKESYPAVTTKYPGRMAALTSSIFILLSIALLLMRKKRFRLFIQVILLTGLAILSMIFLLYISRIGNERFSVLVPASLHTSFTLLLLYIAAFYCYPLRHLRFSFQKKMAGFFTFAILLLIVVFLSFRQNARRFADTANWVEHTNTAILQNLRIKSLAQDIESGTRGYVISGNEDFLDTYYKSIPAIHEAINQLRETTKNSPLQQLRIDTLEELVSSNIDVRKQMIELRRTGGFEAAERFFRTGIGLHRMNELLALIVAIETAEKQLLAKRKALNSVSIGSSTRVIVLFQLVTGLLLLAAFIIIYYNTRFRNRAEKEIRDLNENLEKKVEEKTQEVLKNEMHFRMILDNLLEGAQIIGFDWKYKYVNDAFLLHSKYGRSQLIGYTVMEKYPGIEQVPIFRVYEKCFKERVPIHLENEFVFPDGSIGWFELSFQPVPEGIFILSVDISDRKRAEVLLNELNKTLEKKATELQSSNTELERFAYVASHDLQEPLRMVSSFLHLLERKLEGQLDETSKQYIGFAVDGAERMKTLIQDLLQYSKVGTSKEAITAVDCNKVMGAVSNILALSIGETNAIVKVEKLPVIKAVEPQIFQLFQNLLTNALKYHSDAPPLIEVGCADKGGFHEFYIRDNGIGINPKFFDKIFIIFQRLHNKTAYAGTGIGLSICKKIVERHGGIIWVESAEGKGSTFYFTLPK
ncbi:MAG: CHASE3 domain-containing protein [Chitinophagaceae bacterium]